MLDQSRILTGYNNDNYILRTGSEMVILRIPTPHRFENDIRSLKEGEGLEYLRGRIGNIPEILYNDMDNGIILETFVEGETLDRLYDVETKIPDEYIRELASFFVKLHGLDPLESGLGQVYGSESQKNFFSSVLEQMRELCVKLIDSTPDLYEKMRITRQQVTSFFDSKSINPTIGRIALCHCDVHRKNIIVSKDGHLYIIDWELALIGDPLYDLAIHFQKMRYSDDDIGVFMESYNRSELYPAAEEQPDRIKTYMQMEAVKYAVVDIHHVLANAKAGAINEKAVSRYYKKLTKAYNVLGITERITLDDLKELVQQQELIE